jgi:hypothetical protein
MMALRTGTTAPDDAPGPGEARERARFRRRSVVIGAIFTAGLFSGFYVGHEEADALFHGGDAAWSPTVSLILVAVYLIAVGGGSLLLQNSMDELEKHNSYKAATVAAAVYIILYPVWFVLWKGGLVPEPVHWVVFVAFWLSLCAATLWYRFR